MQPRPHGLEYVEKKRAGVQWPLVTTNASTAVKLLLGEILHNVASLLSHKYSISPQLTIVFSRVLLSIPRGVMHGPSGGLMRSGRQSVRSRPFTNSPKHTKTNWSIFCEVLQTMTS